MYNQLKGFSRLIIQPKNWTIINLRDEPKKLYKVLKPNYQLSRDEEDRWRLYIEERDE
jgi:hypothetical protein